MIDAYFRHVATEDQPKSPAGRARHHRRALAGRAAPRTRARSRSGCSTRRRRRPSGAAGWTDTTTVIDIVTDDMPSLVDSVIGALTSAKRHRAPGAAPDPDQPAGTRPANCWTITDESGRGVESPFTFRESWMHVLIDRLSDAERAEAIEDVLRQALDDVRAVVRRRRRADRRGRRRRGRTARHLLAALGAGGLRDRRLPVLADLREHDVPRLPPVRTPRPDRRRAAVPVDGSGLGILRDRGAARSADDHLLTADGGQPAHLLLTQASTGSALTRDVPPFEVRARILGPDGCGASASTGSWAC